MTNDGSHAYYYDAENRLIQVDGTLGNCASASACYDYDAEGQRARKTVGSAVTQYVYNVAGQVIHEADGNSAFTTYYVPFAGELLAQYENSTTQFMHTDHLGSTRLVTGMTNPSTPVDMLDYLPFGEQLAGGTSTTHKFSGDERDSESNFDHTWFRQYSSQLGRWMHPDPAGLASVDPSNPQSWNRYAYVLNNPLSYKDPSGLYCYYGDTSPDSADWLDDRQYDFHSSSQECGETQGTWYGDTWNQTVTVNADPLPDGSGVGEWISGWWNSFSNLSGTQISVNLNRCAAQQSNKLYSMGIGKSTLANVFLGNTFAAGSQLALGPTKKDRLEGGAGVVLAGPQYPTGNIATQLAAQGVGRISVLGGTQIAAVPGTEVVLGGQTRFATEISRYTAVAVKDTPAFAAVLGKVTSVADGKLLIDGLTYLAMETSCAIGVGQ